MHLICARESLAAALGLAERAAAARENVPVLGGVRLQAGEGAFRLSATDLEMSVTAWGEGSVEQPGDRVVDARLFSALIRRLSGPQVEVREGADGRTLEVRCGSARFSLVSLPGEEFPALPELGDGWRLVLPAGRLEAALAQTRFAAASSDQRPVLSGLLFEVEGNDLRLVATDSSRLAYREVKADACEPFGNPGLFAPKAVVPARAAEEVQRICAALAEDAPVELRMGERLAELRAPTARLVTRLIEGSFPPYRQVFLDGLPRRLRFQREALLESVQRAALLSRRGPAVVQLQVEEEGRTVLRSTEADVGEAEEVLEAEVEGPPFVVAYQARFLEDVLKAFETDQVELHLGDPGRQGTIRVPGEEGYRYIVMPVRLG